VKAAAWIKQTAAALVLSVLLGIALRIVSGLTYYRQCFIYDGPYPAKCVNNEWSWFGFTAICFALLLWLLPFRKGR
jgi:hypothetical protein